MAKASQALLGQIHKLLAEAMLNMLKEAGEAGEDSIPLDAATLGAIRAFLKDNEITCDPADADGLAALREQFSRAKQGGVGPALAAARQDTEDGNYH